MKRVTLTHQPDTTLKVLTEIERGPPVIFLVTTPTMGTTRAAIPTLADCDFRHSLLYIQLFHIYHK